MRFLDSTKAIDVNACDRDIGGSCFVALGTTRSTPGILWHGTRVADFYHVSECFGAMADSLFTKRSVVVGRPKKLVSFHATH